MRIACCSVFSLTVNEECNIVFSSPPQRVRKSRILAFLAIAIIRTWVARPSTASLYFAIHESHITNYHRPLSVMWRRVEHRLTISSRISSGIKYPQQSFYLSNYISKNTTCTTIGKKNLKYCNVYKSN